MSGRVCAACAAVLTGVVASLLGPALAPASAACPNAALRSGPSERLPDCRAYEQVSPVEKSGLDAATLQPPLPAESSACEAGQECTIAYMNVDGAFAGAPANEPLDAYLATRGAAGWQTAPLSPPTPQAPASSRPLVTYAFSSDLSQAVVRVPLQQLTENAPAGLYNLFLRRPDGSYSLLTAATPSELPEAGCGRCFETQDVPAFAGASRDFSHVLFEANDSLGEGAPGGGVENLYEAAGERVRLVGILPDGAIPPGGASAGGGIEAVDEHAGELERDISEDGSRVVFEAASDGGPARSGGVADPAQAGMSELYDRIDGSSTVELSAPARGAEATNCETAQGVCDAEPARYWAASADGSIVYFTSKAALTKESNTGPEERSEEELEEEEETEEPIENPGDDLYRYEVDTGTLTDLTADHEAEDPNGADVLGVVGASEDGAYVYFVAEGHLAADAPRDQSSGEANLYVWHETAAGAGTVTFVAALATPDAAEQTNIELMRTGSRFHYRSDVADWTGRPTESQAYVTPDGTHLAFMSVEPLTGYENRNPAVEEASGEADHEVFEYSAADGRLVCASCDPGGAPPLGSAFIGAKLSERASTPFHQPRSLSDDGSRLFFSSPDPLTDGVSGGSAKVFEYEDGGVQLISGAEAGGEAVFLDASASGDDVFFATREQLVPSDGDELVDVYDARVDGGLAAPPAVMPCQGGACREPLEAPLSLDTPLSASFMGTGNLTPPPRAKLTRKQRLARAEARCRRLKRRRKRLACIATAKRRYAPKHKPKHRRGRQRRAPKRARKRRGG
jgi:hypothetical protein